MVDRKTVIPSPSVPFMQGERLHPVWWQFFLRLFNRTGAEAGDPPLPDDIIPYIEADSSGNPGAVADLYNRIAELEAQLVALTGVLQSSQAQQEEMSFVLQAVQEQQENYFVSVKNILQCDNQQFIINQEEHETLHPIFYTEATPSSAGLMSAADKAKLDSL